MFMAVHACLVTSMLLLSGCRGLANHLVQLSVGVTSCGACQTEIATRLDISLDISCSCVLVQLGMAHPFTTASAC
jgi:hypothetical protein